VGVAAAAAAVGVRVPAAKPVFVPAGTAAGAVAAAAGTPAMVLRGETLLEARISAARALEEGPAGGG